MSASVGSVIVCVCVCVCVCFSVVLNLSKTNELKAKKATECRRSDTYDELQPSWFPLFALFEIRHCCFSLLQQ